MRKLTSEELKLWREAHEYFPLVIKEGTSITPLSYILEGKLEEFKKLIMQKKGVLCQS